MRASLIVTAAGSGVRFRESQPGKSQAPSKLFLDLGGMPVLEKTLRAFSGISQIKETWVTVEPGTKNKLQAWASARKLKNISWIEGGKTRAESVLYALKKTSPRNSWVLVHDGARPMIQTATVKNLIAKSSHYDGILLARKVVPTLKKLSPNQKYLSGTVDRSNLVEAETPQLIKRDFLLRAYKEVRDAHNFTDESSLVEAAGGKMGVLLHTDWNPKITHYSDYELVSTLCTHRTTNQAANDTAEIRIGKGYDIHRLVAGRKLWIGGIHVPFEKGSLGHSDGDALLHSITDAILGALGLGDIGDWFSDRNPKYKDIRSKVLLQEVLQKAHNLGWLPSQIDTNIILEKPRLGPLKIEIRKAISKMTGLTLENVSVKGRTYEGLPPFGTGEAWAAEAIVILKRKKI